MCVCVCVLYRCVVLVDEAHLVIINFSFGEALQIHACIRAHLVELCQLVARSFQLLPEVACMH